LLAGGDILWALEQRTQGVTPKVLISRLFLWLTALAWLCLLPAPAAAQASARDLSLSNYRLGSGDVITIEVLGEDDLKRERIRLSDAATISYPILGEIRLSGKTVGELERIIRDGLRGRYLVNPQVTVTINEYRNFYINGQIKRPGGYPYVPGLTVIKAVSIAGGFSERASQDKIYIVRENDPAQNRTKVGLNVAVYPGDIVTVEESFF
jgi:protein involved in polysaccharide export with SLBB domain